MAVKAPPPAPTPVYSWTGFYGGLAVGARWADNGWTTTDIQPTLVTVFPGLLAVDGSQTTLNNAAARIGAYGGYNWQFAPAWIAGLELDAGWANNSSTVNPVPGTSNAAIVGVNPPVGTVKENWDGTVRSSRNPHYARYSSLRCWRTCAPASRAFSKLRWQWSRCLLRYSAKRVP